MQIGVFFYEDVWRLELNPEVKRIIEEDRKYISGSLVRFTPMVIKRGRGLIIEDIRGKEYIDFLCGAAVTNVGHNHPKVVEAAKRAMEDLVHAGMLYLYNEPSVRLAKLLNEITPGSFRKKIFFGLSGSDAIDCSLKMVRWHSKRPRALAFTGSYHGMTMGSLSLSGFVPSMVKGFMPIVPGITHVPYPFCYRCPFKQEYPDCNLYCLEFIEEQIFSTICPPEEVAAFYFEPIQGDAGVVVPPKEYLPRLLRLCKEYGIISVADEIQTGFGRTGRMFACEHWGIQPDVLVLGKAMASGFPISAVVAKSELMDWTAGSHVLTCAGSTISCEASIATIEVLMEEKLPENAREMGEYLKREFNELKDAHELIGDVRGLGLLLGVDLVLDRETREPARKEAHKVCYRAWELGLVMMQYGKSTLRIAPPLCLTREVADEAISIIDRAITDVETGKVSDERLKQFSSWK